VNQFKQEENKRLEQLNTEADYWARSKKIREYVAAVRARLVERDEDVIAGGGKGEAWLMWAVAQADRLVPLSPNPYSVLDEPDPTL
jgi:hypothetical protein